MKRTLLAAPAVRVELAHFTAGVQQPRHRDRRSRITLVLQGAFCEEATHAVERLAPGDVLFKSHRALHEDRFGETGAKVVSIEFQDTSFETSGAADWRVRRDPAVLRHAWRAFEAGVANDGAGAAAAACDLLAAQEDVPQRRAPAWLTRLKTALEEDTLARVNVAAEAREAGVHPAHASRLFRCCFGVTITDHAQAHSVRRALAHMAQAQSALSDVAAAAGFYDQSHMTRVFRRMTGRSPGVHRALLAAAG